MLTVAEASMWLVGTLSVAFVLVCLFLMLVILIQKPRGGGLAGAFGGAGGAVQTAFGARVGDVLTWVTVVCFVLFLLLSVGLNWSIHSNASSSGGGGTNTQDKAPENPEEKGQ